MTRSFTRLAWLAAFCTYLLIILGAIVRITGSGLGCGEHWPLCNGTLLPPLDLPTMIEYGHRLAAAAVSGLVTALAAYAWWLRQGAGSPDGVPDGPREWYTHDRTACLGFLLCNGQVVPAGNYLQHIHWVHRLLAYTLFGYVWWWALRMRTRRAWWVVGLVTLQVAVAAAMVLLGLPAPLQATHVAVGAAVWAGLVLALL